MYNRYKHVLNLKAGIEVTDASTLGYQSISWCLHILLAQNVNKLSVSLVFNIKAHTKSMTTVIKF